jgi:hypothetical protein
MAKIFRLTAAAIEPVAVGYGSCIASDHITVEGRPVGFMYREEPSDSVDSGWRFLSGAETEEYTDDPDHFAVYDVNTIANYDRTITPHMSAPYGSAFGKSDGGGFVPEAFPGALDV